MYFFTCLRSPLCLPLWLVVSDSLELSFYYICFLDFLSCVSRSTISGSLEVCLHWFLFACLPVWLLTPGGFRLSKYLSLLDHIFFPFFSGFIYVSHNSSVFNHQFASVVVSDSFVCSHVYISSIHGSPRHGSSHSYVRLLAVSCSCFSTYL